MFKFGTKQLNQVIKYIKDFYEREVNLAYLLLVLFMLGVLIYFNYWHGLEKKYVAGGKSKLSNMVGYYFLYLIPFAGAFFLQLLFYKDCSYYKNPWFWAILFLAPALFAFRANFTFHQPLVRNLFSGPDVKLYLYCFNWVVRVFVLLIPVIIIWFWKDRGTQPVYGTRPLDSLKPYLIMILIMIPVIALASTQADFLRTYPKAKILTNLQTSGGLPLWKYLLFELSYGFDFLSIELFFRGFLILSLAHICGQHCIIPAACFYCAIHFGKPMGEAISSFFGGTLLGIIAFNTGSIWGGLWVHLGIAWLMEIGGFAGNLFFKPKN